MRIRFTKRDDLRWISHRDLARVWERLLRRAGLQLAFSEGFHPKPRISFPSALALGIEALDEVVELEVVGELDVQQIQSAILEQLPSGMELLSLEPLERGLGKAKVAAMTYRFPVTVDAAQVVKQRIEEIRKQDRIEIQREKKVVSCDTTHPLFSIELHEEFVEFSLPNVAEGMVRANEILGLLGLEESLNEGTTLQRTHVELAEK